MAKGGVCGKGVCAWQRGGMHGEGGVCAMHPPPGHHEIQSVNARPVRILLECILVHNKICSISGNVSKRRVIQWGLNNFTKCAGI